MAQGSDKQCQLTMQGVQKLEDALKVRFAEIPSDSKVAEFFPPDRETVGKIRNRRGWLNLSSIDRLFKALNLEVKPKDVESKRVDIPNPFEPTGLWGCDALLRRIFEQLGKGGS